MATFNLCNQFDQIAEGKVVYYGTEHTEYADLEQPKEEKPKKKFSAGRLFNKFLGGLVAVVAVSAVVGLAVAYAASVVLTGGASLAALPVIAAGAGVVAAGFTAYRGGQMLEAQYQNDKANQEEGSWGDYIGGALVNTANIGAQEAALAILFLPLDVVGGRLIGAFAAKYGSKLFAKLAIKKTIGKWFGRGMSKAATETATEAGTKAATETATEAGTKVATEATTKAGTKAATETATEAGTKAATETATEAGTKAATETATEAGTKAATEAVTKNLLPNAEKAIIDPRKLTEYALNPEHSVGGNKARVFERALGYNKSNAEALMRQVQAKLPQSEAVLGNLDKYGQRYTIDMQILGANGQIATVRTGWIIETGSSVPKMTTIYVK